MLSSDVAAAIETDSRPLHEQGIDSAWLERIEQEGWIDRARPADRTFALVRALAQHSATLAWVVAGFSEGAAAAKHERLAGGKIVVARNGDARIVREAGRLTLRGAWEPTAAAAHAERFLLACKSESNADGFVAVSASALERTPVEFLGGLHGAGYARLSADGVPLGGDEWLPFSDFTIGEMLAPLYPAAAALGLAEAAYRDYVAATRKRVSGIGGQSVAQFTQVQIRTAGIGAELSAAALMFEKTLREVAAGANDAVALRRDSAFIARKSLESVTQLVRQMGALGLVESNPVQRHYRDVRTLAADGRIQWEDSLVAFGRREFGLPPVDQAAEVKQTG
jgi:alkylation response protein AidB-like acyl-CoA dehydrogenase